MTIKNRAEGLIAYAAWGAQAEYGRLDPAGLHHELKRAAPRQKLQYLASGPLIAIIDPETSEHKTFTRAELWRKATGA